MITSTDKADLAEGLVRLVRDWYDTQGTVPLHEPLFTGNEEAYVLDAIRSTYVSSMGAYVDRFERDLAAYLGTPHAVAMVNGTCALHLALLLAGVAADTEVITQPLTFVATCNAIRHCGAQPVFVDVELDTMGMCPDSLAAFLKATACTGSGGACINRRSGRRIAAVVPMHTFGMPCRIDEIMSAVAPYGIPVVEDAAESLGSTRSGRHCGTFGLIGVCSFNGNKTITSGGGGALLTHDPGLAREAKHLSTTARSGRGWEYTHDTVGYNYRMPNLNAALLCAQLERADSLISEQRAIAAAYGLFFDQHPEARFSREPRQTFSNYWLSTVLLRDTAARDDLLRRTNDNNIMTRPAWTLMNRLPMYAACESAGLDNATLLADRLLNLPSSARRRIHD